MMNCAVQLGKGPFLLLRHSALPAQWQAAQLVSRRCFASPARQPPSRRTYPVETLLRAAAEATEGSVQGPPQPVAPPAADNPFAQLGVDARLLVRCIPIICMMPVCRFLPKCMLFLHP